ncbi:hypothetical protein J6W91_00155 [Candidatus Saccharibacteria bacterium]|nr:hypothetical protein [Candidatus Saccharibacteria bacterium]
MSNLVKSVREKAMHLSLDDDPPSRRKLTEKEEAERQIQREILKQRLIKMMYQKKMARA